VWETEANPLPLNDSIVGEFVALLTNERLATALPEACGEKVTVKGMDCPTARVAGKETPLRTNSGLVLVLDEIVTEEPLAPRLPVKVAFDPVLTLPKFNTEGVRVT
jgi:hypothetical protein